MDTFIKAFLCAVIAIVLLLLFMAFVGSQMETPKQSVYQFPGGKTWYY